MFDLFTTTNYTFLKMDSTAGGNIVTQEYPANGLFKLRVGMVQADNIESFASDATLHIRPLEAFIGELGAELVGHGVRVLKDSHQSDYRITGQVEGYDYDQGTLEFYKVTLKREELAPSPSDLPLE